MSDYIAFEYNGLTNLTTQRSMTAEEIADLETLQAKAEAQETAHQAKADARLSALAKLADLGLTQDEINAL